MPRNARPCPPDDRAASGEHAAGASTPYLLRPVRLVQDSKDFETTSLDPLPNIDIRIARRCQFLGAGKFIFAPARSDEARLPRSRSRASAIIGGAAAGCSQQSADPRGGVSAAGAAQGPLHATRNGFLFVVDGPAASSSPSMNFVDVKMGDRVRQGARPADRGTGGCARRDSPRDIAPGPFGVITGSRGSLELDTRTGLHPGTARFAWRFRAAREFAKPARLLRDRVLLPACWTRPPAIFPS
jgi:hypothetical protein